MTIGFASGMVIRRNTCHCVAPSMIAASSIDLGIVSKNPLDIWNPRPVHAQYTRIRPSRIEEPSVRPMAFRMKYWAIIVMKPGNRPRIMAMFI